MGILLDVKVTLKAKDNIVKCNIIKLVISQKIGKKLNQVNSGFPVF